MKHEPHPDLFNTALMFKRGGTSAAAAAHAAKEARLNNTHAVIWRALIEKPRTADEIAADLKLVLNTARARMTELVKRGWAKRTGETRSTDAGRPADVLTAILRDPRADEQLPDLFLNQPMEAEHG